ncbi:hypothetical protein BA900_07200 [Spiribacter roseus]|nr:hypothetical protein BA900_07200 [Spiribacter roseus]
MLCDLLKATSIDGQVVASAFFSRVVELECCLACVIQFVLASALSVPATSFQLVSALPTTTMAAPVQRQLVWQ